MQHVTNSQGAHGVAIHAIHGLFGSMKQHLGQRPVSGSLNT